MQKKPLGRPLPSRPGVTAKLQGTADKDVPLFILCFNSLIKSQTLCDKVWRLKRIRLSYRPVPLWCALEKLSMLMFTNLLNPLHTTLTHTHL